MTLLAVAMALAVLFSGAVVAATVSSASAETRLAIEVGYGGRHHSGTTLPITVTVSADQLIDGELVARISDGGFGGVVESVPVQLAGGSVKEFHLAIAGVYDWHSVMIELVEGDEIIASQRKQTIPIRTGELIGVLPSLAADLPAQVDLAVDLGPGRLVEVSEGRLALGGQALESLNSLALTNADLATADSRVVSAIDAWVRGGGMLAVDEAPGTLVVGLDAVLGDEGERVAHGSGVLVSTAGEAARGNWDGLFQPSGLPPGSTGNGFVGELTGEVAWFGEPMSTSLARDAGFRLPSLPVLLITLFVYVLLAGPVTWFVLRRRRKLQWFWLTVPTLALVFTGLVWLTGSELRSRTTNAHGTIIDVRDGGAIATTNYLVTSRSGEPQRVTLDPGWTSGPGDQLFGGPVAAQVTASTDDGARVVEAELDAGGFAVIAARGAAPEYADALVVTAESPQDGEVRGTVRNNLDIALHEVAVFADAAGSSVGTIEPGQSVEFRLKGGVVNPRFGQPVEFRVWDNVGFNEWGPWGAPVLDEVSVVNMSLWAQYLTSNTGRARQVGEVVAAGWTNEQPGLGADGFDTGRTLFVGRGVTVAVDKPTNMTVQRELLRGPEQLEGGQPGFDGRGFFVGSAWRFDMPEGVATGDLALTFPTHAGKAEIWTADGWEKIGDDLGGRELLLRPEVVIDGSVHVTVWVNFDEDGVVGRSFGLSAQPVGDTAESMLFPAEIAELAASEKTEAGVSDEDEADTGEGQEDGGK